VIFSLYLEFPHYTIYVSLCLFIYLLLDDSCRIKLRYFSQQNETTKQKEIFFLLYYFILKVSYMKILFTMNDLLK